LASVGGEEAGELMAIAFKMGGTDLLFAGDANGAPPLFVAIASGHDYVATQLMEKGDGGVAALLTSPRGTTIFTVGVLLAMLKVLCKTAVADKWDGYYQNHVARFLQTPGTPFELALKALRPAAFGSNELRDVLAFEVLAACQSVSDLMDLNREEKGALEHLKALGR